MSECTTFLQMLQYLKIPRRNTTSFNTANPRELRWIDEDGEEQMFEDIEYDMMDNLRSYLMHQQNLWGPFTKGKVDLLKATHGSLMDFIYAYDGTYIDYDETEANKGYARRMKEESAQAEQASSPTPSNTHSGDDSSREDRVQEQAKKLILDTYLKVRRNLTDYSVYLRKDEDFPKYQRRVESTSKAHETFFVLDPDNDPLEACGHEEVLKRAQAYMYLVFTETLLTAKGIEFVKDHPGDARKVWLALLAYYTGQSTHARISANKFYKAIVGFNIPPKNQRKYELHQYFNLYTSTMYNRSTTMRLKPNVCPTRTW